MRTDGTQQVFSRRGSPAVPMDGHLSAALRQPRSTRDNKGRRQPDCSFTDKLLPRAYCVD